MATGESTEWALYGGAGFIGQHLAGSILKRHPDDRVTLLDIRDPDPLAWKAPLEPYLEQGRLRVAQADVRDYRQIEEHPRPFDVIVNLAAVHREPGHRPDEYFETNVSGAENLCRLAEAVGCREIIFTSSISVYGVHNRAVDEKTTPQPKTPYGQSKWQAEGIHVDWAKRTGGRLAIVRPGVVFGHGEQGNVTRLMRESLRRGRAIWILPNQAKAGIYIEELLGVFHWLREQPIPSDGFQLFNGVSGENLTFNAYGDVLQKLNGFKKRPLTVSEPLLRTATALMKPLGWMLGTGSRFHPERLAKLTRANDVKASGLVFAGYPFAWPLERALADWLEKGL